MNAVPVRLLVEDAMKWTSIAACLTTLTSYPPITSEMMDID